MKKVQALTMEQTMAINKAINDYKRTGVFTPPSILTELFTKVKGIEKFISLIDSFDRHNKVSGSSITKVMNITHSADVDGIGCGVLAQTLSDHVDIIGYDYGDTGVLHKKVIDLPDTLTDSEKFLIHKIVKSLTKYDIVLITDLNISEEMYLIVDNYIKYNKGLVGNWLIVDHHIPTLQLFEKYPNGPFIVPSEPMGAIGMMFALHVLDCTYNHERFTHHISNYVDDLANYDVGIFTDTSVATTYLLSSSFDHVSDTGMRIHKLDHFVSNLMEFEHIHSLCKEKLNAVDEIIDGMVNLINSTDNVRVIIDGQHKILVKYPATENQYRSMSVASQMFLRRIEYSQDQVAGTIWIDSRGNYSLRSIDGETAYRIAKANGGGGHPNAAGCPRLNVTEV